VYIGTNNEEPRDPKHKGDRGVFLCLDETTGALLWQLVVPKRDEDAYMDWPRMGMSSEATVEGDRVYLVDNRGAVLCLDAKGLADGNDGPFRDEVAYMTPPTTNGAPRQQIGAERIRRYCATRGRKTPEDRAQDADIIWKFDLAAEAGIWPHDAAHSSILIHGDHLYLNTGNGVDKHAQAHPRPGRAKPGRARQENRHWLARDDEHMAAQRFPDAWSLLSMGRVNGRELISSAVAGAFNAFEPLEDARNLLPGPLLQSMERDRYRENVGRHVLIVARQPMAGFLVEHDQAWRVRGADALVRVVHSVAGIQIEMVAMNQN